LAKASALFCPNDGGIAGQGSKFQDGRRILTFAKGIQGCSGYHEHLEFNAIFIGQLLSS